jgi:hypothetical protein
MRLYHKRTIAYAACLIICMMSFQFIRYIPSPTRDAYIYDGNHVHFQFVYIRVSVIFLSVADVHQFVPESLRRFIRKSSLLFTVNDLLNITRVPNNIDIDASESSNNSVHLITQWYYEENVRRRMELIHALHMNVINDAITMIHFIQNDANCSVWHDIQQDSQFPTDRLKLKLVLTYDRNVHDNRRLTIDQVFRYANRFINDGYTILANLDILFDRTLSLLTHRTLVNSQTVFYLSRYEIDPSISTLGIQCSDNHYVGSHDALIFRTPLPSNLIEQLPYELGTWNIEVKMIYVFMNIKYIVRNPCKSIRIWHLHSSQIRHRLMPSKKYISNEVLNRVMRPPEFL